MTRRFFVVLCALVSLIGGVAPAQAMILGTSAPASRPYPFMVAVYVNGGFSCGGTVIAPSWVLTAAHCIGPGNYTVVAGNNSRSRGQVLGVDQALAHPQFNERNFINDVGLLHLTNPTSTPAVALAGPGDDDLEADGARATLVGWGDQTPTLGLLAPDALQHEQLTVLGDRNCFGETSSLNATTTVCTSDLLKGQCNGDSGGPLLGFKNGRWVEFGIVSNSTLLLCGAASYVLPAELAEVNASSIRNWIANIANV